MVRRDPFEVLIVERPAADPRSPAVILGKQFHHRPGHVVDKVLVLTDHGDQHRIGIPRRGDPVGAVDIRANHRGHGAEERCDLVHPGHPLGVVRVDRRPEHAARTGRRLVGLAGVGRGEGGVDLAVDHALPRGAEAAEHDLLDIVPGQAAIGEVGLVVDIQGRGALDPGHPHALEIGIFEALAIRLAHLLAGLRRNSHGQADTAAIVGDKDAHLLRPPVLLAEGEDTLLGHERAADAGGRERDLALAQWLGTGDVVLAGQHAQVQPEHIL